MSKVREFIREIRAVRQRTKRNRYLIRELAGYLISGKYKNTDSFDCIYNTKAQPKIGRLTFTAKNRAETTFDKCVELFNKGVTYSVAANTPKVFNGTEVIVSSTGTEYKIFDFVKKLVLTIYESQEKMMHIQENKNKIRGVFNVPDTVTINSDKSYVVEKLIQHHELLVDDAFRILTKSMNDNLTKQKEYTFRDKAKYQKNKDYFASRFGQSKLLDNAIGEITTLTHGDFWSSNVIYDGHLYYITDFERVGDRFFLYDFFMFMFSEWLLNKNSLLLDNYFSGEYDAQLDKMFYSVDSEYITECKQEYFLIFLVSITYERWQNYNGIDHKIKELIDIYLTAY